MLKQILYINEQHEWGAKDYISCRSRRERERPCIIIGCAQCRRRTCQQHMFVRLVPTSFCTRFVISSIVPRRDKQVAKKGRLPLGLCCVRLDVPASDAL